MDLIRLLRSLEEFLYELVGWLVFYPRTFWRVVRHPGDIARYTRAELAKDPEHRFQATISPVLMLILSVALAHALEMAFRIKLPVPMSPVGQVLFGSEQGIMLTRSAVFCVYALGAALGTLRRQRLRVTRETLREPFSIQAFLACPFVIALAIGDLLVRMPGRGSQLVGVAIVVLAVAWYIGARVAAYRALDPAPWWRVFGWVIASFLITTVAILVIVGLILA